MNLSQPVYGEFTHLGIKRIGEDFELLSVEKLKLSAWLQTEIPKDERQVTRLNGIAVDVYYSLDPEKPVNLPAVQVFKVYVRTTKKLAPRGSVVFVGFNGNSIGKLEFDELHDLMNT